MANWTRNDIAQVKLSDIEDISKNDLNQKKLDALEKATNVRRNKMDC